MNIPDRKRFLSMILIVIGCAPAYSDSDGLVPAVVVRGEDSPNASAIMIAPHRATARKQLPNSSAAASAENVPNLSATKKEAPTKKPATKPTGSTFRTSEFEFGSMGATTNAETAGPAPQLSFQPMSGGNDRNAARPDAMAVDTSILETAAFHGAITSDADAVASELSHPQSQVQQTQFLHSDTSTKVGRLELPPGTFAGRERSRDMDSTSGPTDSFAPVAVSVGEPSLATPEAYLAAPADDPTAIAAKSKSIPGKAAVAGRARFTPPVRVSAHSKPANVSMNPFQLQARPVFAGSPPTKSGVARPSGLQSATLVPGKKPAGNSILPKISLPSINFKKPSWLGSKRK